MRTERFRSTGDAIIVEPVEWKPLRAAPARDHFGAFGRNAGPIAAKTAIRGHPIAQLRALQGKNVEAALATNDFFISRGLAEYCNMFTPQAGGKNTPNSEDPFPTKSFREMYEVAKAEDTDLFKVLMALSKDAVWLDAGAGYALAQRMYRARGGDAQLVAVGLERPAAGVGEFASAKEDAELSSFDAADARFRYVEGKIQDPAILERIGRGKVNVITDMFGAFAYSNPPEVLQAYADLLVPGGLAYLHFSGGDHISVRQPDGRSEPFVEWLAGLELFEIERRSIVVPLARRPLESLVLRRTEVEGLVPPLTVLKVDDQDLPPKLILAVT